jgi:hypothetical protein
MGNRWSLFAKDLAQLKSYIPELKPSYTNNKLFYYYLIEQNEIELMSLMTLSLWLFFNTILNLKSELASHTFCHYYVMKKDKM